MHFLYSFFPLPARLKVWSVEEYKFYGMLINFMQKEGGRNRGGM